MQSVGWQANVGPTSAKSADHATNSQRRSDRGMLSGLYPYYFVIFFGFYITYSV